MAGLSWFAEDGLAAVDDLLAVAPHVQGCLPPHSPVPKPGPCPGPRKPGLRVGRRVRRPLAPAAPAKTRQVPDPVVKPRPPAPPATLAQLAAKVSRSLPKTWAAWDRAISHEDGGTGVPVYPRDASGRYAMPSTTLNKHLDSVLTVGRAVLAQARDRMATDAQLADLRARPDTVSREPGMDVQTRMEARRAEALARVRTRREIRRREAEILRGVLHDVRPFGGVAHQLLPARGSRPPDGWRDQIALAEIFFPQEWLRRSARAPLRVGRSDRAAYESKSGTIYLTGGKEGSAYNGAFEFITDEHTVHELGHRMEDNIQGLRHLEFTLVRRRSTLPDGTLEPPRRLGTGYRDEEEAFEDRWYIAYTGKTYEGSGEGSDEGPPDPASYPWEAFQVGLQDVFGRSTEQYGDDELQEFVLGALLTLGSD